MLKIQRRATCGLPIHTGYIYNRTPVPKAQGIQKRAFKGSRNERTKTICCDIDIPRNKREASHMASQQNVCLNQS